MFSNVDLVIFSNIVDGHYIPNEKINSWKLENYFSLILVNPNNSNINSKAREKLLEIIPNSTLEFEKYYDDYCRTVKLEAINKNCPELEQYQMLLLVPHYFDQYYSGFWKNE